MVPPLLPSITEGDLVREGWQSRCVLELRMVAARQWGLSYTILTPLLFLLFLSSLFSSFWAVFISSLSPSMLLLPFEEGFDVLVDPWFVIWEAVDHLCRYDSIHAELDITGNTLGDFVNVLHIVL